MRFAQAFTGAAFEENVVGNNDGGGTVLLQHGKDVLEEVELFVARARLQLPRCGFRSQICRRKWLTAITIPNFL